nr:integrase, catalytic region, zinc finger, CCHC-type, peptidase aspartic, catalytic [Tanacetum cinerariifolium]
MGTVREPLAEGTEGAPHLGPERPRVYSDLSLEEKDRNLGQCQDAPGRVQINQRRSGVTAGRFVTAVKLNRGLRDSNYDQLYAYLKQHEPHAKENKMMLERFSQHTVDPLALMSNVSNPQRGGAAGFGGVQNRVGNANPGQARQVKCYNCNGIGYIARNCIQPKHPQNSAYYKDKMLLMQALENGVDLDVEQLLFLAGGQDNAFDDDVDEQPVQDLALNVDNVFQADDCDAFDSDVDEAPMAQTMFMANLSSVDPVTDEAGPSYDSNILSEYVKDNEVPVVHNDVSSVLNDAFMMIYNDTCEPHAQSVSNPLQNIVVENSLTTKLATYKEQVELYERRAKFELTKIEQKINEQLRLVISDRNFKEETLKKELHYIKLQLVSTINHNKSMVEEVTFLKKDFKQKENKYLEDFLDMKSLKEKVEDRFLKQDQSLQTVHMLCRPKPYYNELNKVATGYKNPLRLTCAKQVQPALYNGHEIIKDNHAPAIVHNKEDTLEIAEITRKKMNDKMKDPECVTRKVKIVPHDYSKDNFLATFTPQKQLTPEQIFWSQDLIKLKFKALKEQTTHYKELYDSIKITRAKHIEQVTALNTKNLNLKAQILEKFNSVSKDQVKPKVLARGKHAIDVKPIVPRLRNNRDAHLDYLMHLKESVETIRDIVEEVKVVRPLDRSIVSAYRYTKHSQELLEYAIGTCPQDSLQRDKQLAHIPLIRKSKLLLPTHLIRVKCCTSASGSQPRSNTKNNRISPAKGVNKPPIEEQSRNNKFLLRTSNCVDSSSRIKRTIINLNLDSVCKTCNKCLISSNHDMSVVTYLQSVVAPPSIRYNCNVVRKVVQIVLWYLDSGCLKHMMGDCSRLMNFVKKFIGTVRFRNDHFGAIMGYGDYVIGDSVISRVYYVEGLGHNLFSVGQFCDSDLEVAFRNHYCYVRDTDGVELIKGSRGSNLYTISIKDMMKSSLICLLYKSSKNKSWLWHWRLNYLNFGSKDETPEVVIKFIQQIQVGLNKTVRYICTDNDKKFVNQTLTDYYERIGIFHQKTVPRTLQQNDVVERWNCTLVKAALTMLMFSKAPMFLWAEAVATACYTQNHSLIHTRHNKTLYELVHNKKPDLTFFRVFGALCYPTNDSEDLEKLQPTADIGIFVGYAPSRKGYRIYNKRTQRIMETIHISSWLDPNPVPATPYVPPTNKDLEILFQPMFDEYLEPPRVERPVCPAQVVQAPVNSASTPSSTTID